MKKISLVKFLGITATLLGAGTTVLSDWVNEKQMDEKIEEKVNEALQKKN